MGCTVCGKEETTGVSIWGQFCSPECANAFHQRRRQRQAELRAEPLFQAPPELTVPDFEAFALKVAVYATSLDAVQGVPEQLHDPDILALQVKEILLRHLPEEYVSTWQEGSGWFRRGRYSFRRPVPMELVRAAMQAAGFEWRVAWFGSEANRAFLATELGAQWDAIREKLSRAAIQHVRPVGETDPATATSSIDSATFEPLVKELERLNKEWRLHHDAATECLSKARDLSAHEAVQVLHRLDHSLRVLALGPANTA
jgi:hypothetical protein